MSSDGSRGRKRPRRRWLEPRESLNSKEVERGLRYLLLDGVSTQIMGAFTGGALLVAFALELGASHAVIGLIAAVGPLSQLLQAPAAVLVERTRRRKLLVLSGGLLGRGFWVLIAAIPWVVPTDHRLTALVASLFAYFGSSAVSSAAYNSWKRDLVPEARMARYFAKRLTIATAAGAVMTVAAGVFVDGGRGLFQEPLAVFSPLFLIGGLWGVLGIGFLGRIPEPRMEVARGRGLVTILTEPLRDENYRSLVIFLACWNFAVNLAAPFFAVYLLVRLEVPLTWVLALSVLSQVCNLVFLRVWGGVADRRGHKTVLGLTGPLFIVSIALWPFTTLPERYFLTVPLLILIHALAGISTAGVNLCAGSITLKLAPRGKATAFLAVNALVSGIAATLAPALGGLVGDRLANRRLSLDFRWAGDGAGTKMLTPLDLQGLDFVFALAVLFGLYAVHRLLAVREPGAAIGSDPRQIYGELRRAVRNVSTAAGLRRLSAFPYATLFERRSTPEPSQPSGDTGEPPPTPPRTRERPGSD